MKFALRPARLAWLLTAALIAGCGDYSLSVNERVVYEPATLFGDYRLDDPALRDCVAQAIRDQGAARASDLQDLNCSDAGIRSLAGLEVFSGLQRVKLDNNLLSELTPLYDMKQLQELYLRNNRLQTVSSQFCTIGLKQIALAGNDSLDCGRLDALEACGVRLTDIPTHCATSAD